MQAPLDICAPLRQHTPSQDLYVEITRSAFEYQVEPLLQRCMDVVVDVLAQAHFSPVSSSCCHGLASEALPLLAGTEGVHVVWSYTVASA
jgi:molecular chaperone DnaK (HSP70)